VDPTCDPATAEVQQQCFGSVVPYDLVRLLSFLLHRWILAQRPLLFGRRRPHPPALQGAHALSWRHPRWRCPFSRRHRQVHFIAQRWPHFLVQRFDCYGLSAWFGGIGYILSTHSRFVGVIVLAFAIAGGLSASLAVFKFMVKLMNAESSHLKDEDYRHEGLVCTVTMPVRENGTGEIIFMQNGVRRSAGARSCNGKPLEKGAEVVIERYENGVAYVHRWEEFTS
jgi:hypothetical protein